MLGPRAVWILPWRTSKTGHGRGLRIECSWGQAFRERMRHVSPTHVCSPVGMTTFLPKHERPRTYCIRAPSPGSGERPSSRYGMESEAGSARDQDGLGGGSCGPWGGLGCEEIGERAAVALSRGGLAVDRGGSEVRQKLVCLQLNARDGAETGGSLGSPRYERIRRAVPGSKMKAITLRSAPHSEYRHSK